MRAVILAVCAVCLALASNAADAQNCCPGGVCTPPSGVYATPMYARPQAQPRPRRLWDWIDLKPHHAAVVGVRAPTGKHVGPGRTQFNVGSGVVVFSDGSQAVALTCKHVTAGASRALVEIKGERFEGAVIGEAADADVAAIRFACSRRLVCLPIATTGPPVGSDVEFLGWGVRNPQFGLRRFMAMVCSSGDQLQVDKHAMDGDSGGAIVFRGLLVGIIWGGRPAGTISVNGQRFGLVRPACAWGCGPIRALLRRVFPLALGGAQPLAEIPTPPALPEIPTPPPIDVAELAKQIAAELKTDPAFLSSLPIGPPGPAGPPGETGPEGPPGEAGARLEKIHVDSDGVIYATYGGKQEKIGDMPFLRESPAYFEIVPKK